ncbi:uncharacterized protein LOC114141228 isoform X1 [Xiphophorus couchianus]|uniref:uncharacterized protein LOC114141228 isoform X1 n=1 Tax=Xiphophorus couchianus TaxID=32473 RepID=UPI0010167ED0|nr:uncharacterized protein LOC114141228 isoform X1 [Xiphophorus couchianus]XP_027867515.1 uncharacterized protein LOC114141228 isoform X1 [Xiphophorus couchianus]
MQNVVTNLALGKLQTYFAIVVIFTYSILLRTDFECTCKSTLYYCIIYAVTPALIATVLMLWSNRLFQRTCSYRSRFKSFICCQVLKAALVGLLWVAFLLIDGDWWACCFNKLSEKQAACKAATNISDIEMADLKITSRVSGCWLLFLIVFSGAMSSWTRWRSSCSKGTTQYEETLYYKLVLEEEEAVLKEVLRKSIRTKLTEQIETKCKVNWKDCFNVAEEVMRNQINQLEKKVTRTTTLNWIKYQRKRKIWWIKRKTRNPDQVTLRLQFIFILSISEILNKNIFLFLCLLWDEFCFCFILVLAL